MQQQLLIDIHYTLYTQIVYVYNMTAYAIFQLYQLNSIAFTTSLIVLVIPRSSVEFAISSANSLYKLPDQLVVSSYQLVVSSLHGWKVRDAIIVSAKNT